MQIVGLVVLSIVLAVSAFRAPVVNNIALTSGQLSGDVTIWITNTSGVYTPGVMYGSDGKSYVSTTGSWFNITDLWHVIGMYQLQSSVYTVPLISISTHVPLFANESCAYSSVVVAGTNTTVRPATFCCKDIDTTDDGKDAIDLQVGVSYFPGAVSYEVWSLVTRGDDLLVSGNYQVAGNLGSFSKLSMSVCFGYPYVDCSHNASTTLDNQLPIQIFRNSTDGTTFTNPSIDGKYLHKADWVAYYSTNFASAITQRARVGFELCAATNVYCNGTVCQYSYQLGNPIDTNSFNFTDVALGVVGVGFDNNSGFVRLLHNLDYAIALTYHDLIMPMAPQVVWVNDVRDCAKKEVTLSYVNHGEAGELVVTMYFSDGTSRVMSLIVASGISSLVLDFSDLTKICTAGASCYTLTSVCDAGAVDPKATVDVHTAEVFDSKDKMQEGFVVSTIVLGAIIVGTIGVIASVMLYKRWRGKKYQKVSQKKGKGKGGQGTQGVQMTDLA